MAKSGKLRLDALLVERQLCSSRNLAQRLIRAGEVKVNRAVMDKPGTLVARDAKIDLAQKPPFVSRGGEKLAKALQVFDLSISNRICLDGGISTGGFTDCLLKTGAERVYGIDVGYGQVAWSIRQNPRVILKERTNFRHLTPEVLYGQSPDGEDSSTSWATLGVMDVSFISLTKLLSPLWNLLAAPREVVLLVKPQFEVGRDKIGKKGVVRDPLVQAGAINQVWQAAQAIGWQFAGLTGSPITGPAGNVEYLLWLKQTSSVVPPTELELNALTQQTFALLTHRSSKGSNPT